MLQRVATEIPCFSEQFKKYTGQQGMLADIHELTVGITQHLTDCLSRVDHGTLDTTYDGRSRHWGQLVIEAIRNHMTGKGIECAGDDASLHIFFEGRDSPTSILWINLGTTPRKKICVSASSWGKTGVHCDAPYTQESVSQFLPQMEARCLSRLATRIIRHGNGEVHDLQRNHITAGKAAKDIHGLICDMAPVIEGEAPSTPRMTGHIVNHEINDALMHLTRSLALQAVPGMGRVEKRLGFLAANAGNGPQERDPMSEMLAVVFMAAQACGRNVQQVVDAAQGLLGQLQEIQSLSTQPVARKLELKSRSLGI